jgi:hypothetical protein
MVITAEPAETRWPTWTCRLVTTPSIGERMTVRSRSSRAWSSLALAAAMSGLVSIVEPAISA